MRIPRIALLPILVLGAAACASDSGEANDETGELVSAALSVAQGVPL